MMNDSLVAIWFPTMVAKNDAVMHMFYNLSIIIILQVAIEDFDLQIHEAFARYRLCDAKSCFLAAFQKHCKFIMENKWFWIGEISNALVSNDPRSSFSNPFLPHMK